MKKLFFLLAILAVISALAYNFYLKATSTPYLSGGEDISFVVKPGDGVEEIANGLEEKGLIGSPAIFKYYVRHSGSGSELKAGLYTLKPSLSMREIVDVLVKGANLDRERNITIIEGWKISDIDEYLSREGVLEAGEFAALADRSIGDWAFGFAKPAFLDTVPASADLEGFLFPDTYRIFIDTSAEDIIERLLDNFGDKLSEKMVDDMEAGGRNLYETVILASIIEREVFGDDDRRVVSGILNTRLEIGMALQVDSTINYITGKKDPSAAYADLEIDSPYNTYKYRGLPPGPISNPSLSAIEAAVYPQDSDYLYYLNRQDTGKTIFSRTLDEHNANKYKYLK